VTPHGGFLLILIPLRGYVKVLSTVVTEKEYHVESPGTAP
jgi:hypothetical protein